MCHGLFCLNKDKGFDTLNKIWNTFKRVGDPIEGSRVLWFQDSSEMQTSYEAGRIGSREVERMLKALTKSLENKHLNPRTLEPSNPGPLSPN